MQYCTIIINSTEKLPFESIFNVPKNSSNQIQLSSEIGLSVNVNINPELMKISFNSFDNYAVNMPNYSANIRGS
jgi:hypothetical protein